MQLSSSLTSCLTCLHVGQTSSNKWEDKLDLSLIIWTTSVVTNSIFRGFIEKQKLTGPNFIDWYRQLRIVLSVMDKLDYQEQAIPPTSVPAQVGQQVALEALTAHAA
ncbi:hypothetical protein Tco_0140635 [Tanacetum coccineum]